MKVITLIKLMDNIPCESVAEKRVLKRAIELVELYQSDSELDQYNIPFTWTDGTVTVNGGYYDQCSCNPKNGGNGICNCTYGQNEILHNTTN